MRRLSAALDPEEARTLIGQHHRNWSEVISRYGGVMDRFSADEMLVCFGYPPADEFDAEEGRGEGDGSPRTEAGCPSRRDRDRCSAASPSSEPPAARAARPATSSMCASSTPNRYVDHDPMEWTMTLWIERPRLRLRLPVTPRIAAAHTSGAPARTGCDASAITRPNHRARHYSTAAHPRAPRHASRRRQRARLARLTHAAHCCSLAAGSSPPYPAACGSRSGAVRASACGSAGPWPGGVAPNRWPRAAVIASPDKTGEQGGRPVGHLPGGAGKELPQSLVIGAVRATIKP